MPAMQWTSTADVECAARKATACRSAAGYSGVIRYLSFEPLKNLSIGERDRLWAEGLSIGLVWETTAQAPLQGFNRGASDALARPHFVPALLELEPPPNPRVSPLSVCPEAYLWASAASRGDIVYSSDVDDLERLRKHFPSVRVLAV